MKRLGALLVAVVLCAQTASASEEEALLRRLHDGHILLLQCRNELRALERSGAPADDIAAQRSLLAFLRDESSKLLAQLPARTAARELIHFVVDERQYQTIETLGTWDYATHRSAEALARDGHADEAVRQYQEILRRSPNDGEASLALGRLYLDAGRFEEAERAFYDAIRADASNRSRILLYYQRKAADSSGDDALRTQLGYIYYMDEEWSKADEAFHEALRLNPSNPLARAGLDNLRREWLASV